MSPEAKKPSKPARGEKRESHSNGDILTLSEASAYLRLPEEELKRLAREGGLPGREIGKEWRFFKAALQSWLSTPRRTPGTQAILAMAGKFKDDPFLDEIIREVYRQRGRRSEPEDA